jgi:hypothetical protein
MKLTYFTDPGHGWVRVKRDVLGRMGIEDRISQYSYQRGEYVYLEEDCDLTVLFKALELDGKKLELVERHTNRSSKIRSYSCYFYRKPQSTIESN